MSQTLVTYISGHGYGHAARTIEVLNALRDRKPDLRIVIRSAVSAQLVTRTVRPGIELQPLTCDTGAVQVDSLQLDHAETIRRATAFMAAFDERVAGEAARLRQLGASLVLADIPPLGIAAGHAAGLPTVAMGNFTWDWIYAACPGGEALADAIGRIHTLADRTLRLPLWGGFATARNIVDVPLVARRSGQQPHDVRRRLGWPLDERLVLVSFGGYGVEGLDLDALSRLPGHRVILSSTTPVDGRALGHRTIGHLWPLDEAALYASGLRYEDVVRAVDVVATKPGYGIIAECVANDAALLYTSRGAFAEYDVLVAALPGLLPSAYIERADLLAGRWLPALDTLAATPRPAPVRVDGADVAAQLLLDMM